VIAPKRGYTAAVRSSLGVLLVLLIVLVTTADRVACPDGCADEGRLPGSESSAPSLCGLCHGWSAPAAAEPLAPTLAPVLLPTALELHRRPAHLPAIEHPPRLT
jgi:hypothetical protein